MTPRHLIPKFRCDKPKNLGLVVLNGTQHDLGPYGSPESVSESNRLIQEWLTRGAPAGHPVDPSGPGLTIDERILAFWTRFAQNITDGRTAPRPANWITSATPWGRFGGSVATPSPRRSAPWP